MVMSLTGCPTAGADENGLPRLLLIDQNTSGPYMPPNSPDGTVSWSRSAPGSSPGRTDHGLAGNRFDQRGTMTDDVNDETPIRQLLDRLNAAWNAGDPIAYADLFTADASYVTFFGQNLPGRRAIEETHRVLFQGPLKGSQIGWSDAATIRFLRPDVAHILGQGARTDAEGVVQPELQSTIGLIAVRDDDQWRFAAFQNTRRTPMPGPEPVN